MEFIKNNIQLELRHAKRQQREELYGPICLSDLELDDEWITEREDAHLSDDCSWMDVQECFIVDEGSSINKRRKRGIMYIITSLY